MSLFCLDVKKSQNIHSEVIIKNSCTSVTVREDITLLSLAGTSGSYCLLSNVTSRNQPHTWIQRQKLHDQLNRCRKSLWQNPTYLHNKNLRECGTRVNMPKYTEIIFGKHTASVILDGENLEGILLRSDMRQGCSQGSLLCNVLSPSWSSKAREGKGYKQQKKQSD